MPIYLLKINRVVDFLKHQLFSVRLLLTLSLVCLGVLIVSAPAKADDAYVRHYLATEPVALEMDEQGSTRQFTPEDFSEGKELFELHCLNCHVGGMTLPDPTLSLSMENLAGATPPRDNINAIVAFLREPMTYDGREPSFWCRQVPESWMPRETVEKLAAFVLRAAQKAPGWGTEEF